MTRTLTLTLMTGLLLGGPAIAQTAGYTVTFDATWSAETHPTSFPPSPHFSGLVGGVHDSTVTFWEPGELASLGIKRMAEWGSQTDLLNEIQAAIDAGQAGTTIVDVPLWTVPGSTSADLTVSTEFPLVTLVAMIAPSPDWFIGVNGLDLRNGDGWAQEVVVEVFALDAGTDSGPNYTSGDQATVPPVPIFAITGAPFTPGVPIGTLTFTRTYVSAVPEAPAFGARAYPNPFNPRTTIAWDLPKAGQLKVTIYDVAGRRVRNLWVGRAEAGPGKVSWDGKDQKGRMARAGMYLAAIQSGSQTESVKITLVK